MSVLSCNVADALEMVRSRCPGWSFAILRKALVQPATSEAAHSGEYTASLETAWQWAQERLPVTLKRGEESREASTQATFKAAARWALSADGTEVEVHGEDGATCRLKAAEAVHKALASVVPTQSPKTPRVAFVGLEPSDEDAAAGRPFSDEDGAYLAKHYLEPLGLQVQDVMLCNCWPVAGAHSAEEMVEWTGFCKRELDTYRPAIVVALGGVAKRYLGDSAQFQLPHPAVLRKRGDSGEVARKLRAVREQLDHVLAAEAASRKGIVVPAEKGAETREIKILKTVQDKQIVMGVVLDGYQYDSQGDWIPPAAIEASSHDWMEKSRVVGLQHAGPADAVVVESFLWPYPTPEDYQAAMAGQPHNAYASQFGNQIVHSGSWVIGVKVNDQATWEAVEQGLITGYSIGGTGLQTPATEASMPAVSFITQ